MSVIIPAYNQGSYIGGAIQSVLDQTYPDFELVVVDDGSNDNTQKVVFGFDDPRLHYIFQENRGLSAARNTGILNTSAPYLTFLDSDDLFLPKKIELLVTELNTKPDIGLIAGQAIPIDENGQPIGKTFNTSLPEDPKNILLGNPLHVGSVMLRRTWQEKVGLFDESLRSYEDWDMWLRLSMAGCRMGWVPKPVSLYRFHSTQMTRIGKQMTTSTFAVLDKIFRDPDMPDSWRNMSGLAYSKAHLRAAAQSYHASDYDNAKLNLEKAVYLNPKLLEDEARQLAAQFMAWTDLPKTHDRLLYLEKIYNNLPKRLIDLHKQRKNYLGAAAVQIAFEAYHGGDFHATRYAVVRALLYRPKWILNWGVIVIFLRSCLFKNNNESDPDSYKPN